MMPTIMSRKRRRREKKGENTRKAKSYPCVDVCGERLPLLKIRQKGKEGEKR
jgi:hypothetical protein